APAHTRRRKTSSRSRHRRAERAAASATFFFAIATEPRASNECEVYQGDEPQNQPRSERRLTFRLV
uniref:Uncharacterized protein n=1 Tax=Anopheles dirus TaxID=7168 RepID=A0A182NX33_9DIPT